ncbi:MAG: hypothetical protein PVI26_12450, partial [Chitinispirillia bacterium]
MITLKNNTLIILLIILAVQAPNSAETSAVETQTKSVSPGSSVHKPVVDSSINSEKTKQKPQKAPVRLLLTRAGEGTSSDEIEKKWFSAVLEGYYNLRLLPFIEHLIPGDDFKKSLSKPDDFGISIPEWELFRIAQSLGATHVLLHTYDLENGTVTYYLEIVGIDKKKVVMSFDKSFPFDKIEQNLLECSGLLIEKLELSYPEELIESIKRPILGSDLDNIESLGNIIIDYDKKYPEKTAEKFLKFIEKDPSSALAVYMAALAHK